MNKIYLAWVWSTIKADLFLLSAKQFSPKINNWDGRRINSKQKWSIHDYGIFGIFYGMSGYYCFAPNNS